MIKAMNDVASDGKTAARFEFDSGDDERDAAMVYYDARAFDPTPGQVLEYDTMNVYRYADTNPQNTVDPTGL